MRQIVIALILLPGSFSVFSQKRNVYLIGDGGKVGKQYEFFEQVMDSSTKDDLLIFLGDNIYPQGMPPIDHKDREKSEKIIKEQLNLIKNFRGQSFIVPGNHDWAQGREYGWQNVKEQEKFVSQYLEDKNVFYPKDGCPGPVEVPIAEGLVLILFDFQYLLHGEEKPGKESNCDAGSNEEMIAQFSDMIERNKEKQILVAAHHPIFSYGVHGGYSNYRHHLFPLVDANRALWIPLPVIGSIYPLYRKFIGSIQDITNKEYQAIRDQLLEAMNQTENVIYVNGHEHSQQYIQKGKHHFIVTGSAAKSSYVKKGEGTVFYDSDIGMAVIQLKKELSRFKIKFFSADRRSLIEEIDIRAFR